MLAALTYAQPCSNATGLLNYGMLRYGAFAFCTTSINKIRACRHNALYDAAYILSTHFSLARLGTLCCNINIRPSDISLYFETPISGPTDRRPIASRFHMLLRQIDGAWGNEKSCILQYKDRLVH